MKEFNPIAGLTIKEACTRALLLSIKTNNLVHMLINDIHMYITPKSNLDNIIRLYHYKKDMEYKIKMGLVKGYNR